MFEPDGLLVLVGAVLSLVFGHFPPAADWFEMLDRRWKPLFMLGALLVVTLGKLLFICRMEWSCIELNYEAALWGWLQAVIANQGTYLVAVRQFDQKEEV